MAVVMICMFGQYTCRKVGGPGGDFDGDKVDGWGKRTADLSTPLRSGRDDNSFLRIVLSFQERSAELQSLGSPGFPVESCGFGQLHVVLFKENHISGAGESGEVGNPGTLGMTKEKATVV